jgi:hypothetical protein
MAIRIFGHPPIVSDDSAAVNVVFQNGEKMVSLALDDSCGRMSTLSRGSIECHRKKEFGEDPPLVIATEEVFGPDCRRELVHNTLENFNKAMNWLNRIEYGFAGQVDTRFPCSER